MTADAIKVRRAHLLDGLLFGDAGQYRAAAVWRVYRDGYALPYLVVLGRSPVPFRTLVAGDEHSYPRPLVTSWHLGISPGDLARRYTPSTLEIAP